MDLHAASGLGYKLSAVTLGRSLGTRRIARRVAAVNGYEFSVSMRRRLRLKHPDLGAPSITLIEAATRQWFRLLARRPKARLSMPSRVVDDLWHEMLLHTRDYAAFCDAAIGRFVHHEPESAMPPKQARANQSEGLLTTLLLARADENCPPDTLPLLFRVDQEVGLDGARRYIIDCRGGRSQCYGNPNPHLMCLAHLAGWGRPQPGLSQPRAPSHHNTAWMGHGCGGAGGGGSGGSCGGGCGGCGS